MKTVGADPEIRGRLGALRDGKVERASQDEISSVVDSVLSTLDGDLTLNDLKLYRELEALTQFIKNAKSEIAAVRPQDISDHDIPLATDELDAVVGATEEATGKILDAAEILENLTGTLDAEPAATVNDAVTRIYEACNFQDVTGQRITKVVKTLKVIEDRVSTMLTAFGEEIAKLREEGGALPMPIPKAAPKAAATGDKAGDQDLLHGPSLPDDAKKQAEIDAILASFD